MTGGIDAAEGLAVLPPSNTVRSKMGDAALMARVAQGVAGALAEIYELHSASVHVAARGICAPDQADDVVQTVFLHLWQKPASFDPERGSLRTYLLMMSRARAVDLVRSTTARCNREQRCGTDPTFASAGEANEEHGRGEPDARLLLARLPPDERMAISLAFFGGLTYRQVATVLDQAEGTVKSRIRRGLRRLHEVLADDRDRTGPNVR